MLCFLNVWTRSGDAWTRSGNAAEIRRYRNLLESLEQNSMLRVREEHRKRACRREQEAIKVLLRSVRRRSCCSTCPSWRTTRPRPRPRRGRPSTQRCRCQPQMKLCIRINKAAPKRATAAAASRAAPPQSQPPSTSSEAPPAHLVARGQMKTKFNKQPSAHTHTKTCTRNTYRHICVPTQGAFNSTQYKCGGTRRCARAKNCNRRGIRCRCARARRAARCPTTAAQLTPRETPRRRCRSPKARPWSRGARRPSARPARPPTR
jgi:hypothetical protein